MRAVLDYCTGGIQRPVPAGTLVLHEGSKTGHLFVLIEGRLEVIKGDTVVAVHHRAGRDARARCRCCSISRIPRPCAPPPIQSIYEFDDAASFLRDQPAVALLIARLLAQRLNVANTYLADIMHQYAGHGNHLSMVGELLQSMINLPPIAGLARLGSAIRPKDMSQAGGSGSARPAAATARAGRCIARRRPLARTPCRRRCRAR